AVTYRGTSVPGGDVRGPGRRTAWPCAISARMAVTLPDRANRANLVPNRRGSTPCNVLALLQAGTTLKGCTRSPAESDCRASDPGERGASAPCLRDRTGG